MNGQYSPGQRLPEAILAQKHRVSRHVVREALQALVGEGLVTTDHYRGRSVMNPSTRQVEGLYLLRISLESTAAALAAYKVTSEQARQLKEKAFLPDSDTMQLAQLVEWEAAIHRAIWEVADEPVLSHHLEKLIFPFMEVSLMREGRDTRQTVTQGIERERSQHPKGHGPLVQAICGQNPAAAHEAMVVHLLMPGIGKYSKETMSSLTAAFPFARLRDQFL